MSVEVTRLDTGLTVVTDTMPHLETAALGVWAGVGGRDEKANEHGISHLLEHMAFKGTTRRSSREIVEEIEAVGEFVKEMAQRCEQLTTSASVMLKEIKATAARYRKEGKRIFNEIESCSSATDEVRQLCETFRDRIAAKSPEGTA